MSYANVVSRTDAAGLIPQPVANAIISAVTEESAALRLFTTVPLSSGTNRLPVVSLLPTAYFVTPTDTGLKQTTEVNWADVTLTVEEIAAIVPIPQSVFDDAAFDMWAQIRPLMAAAIGRALDAAIFFGTSAPASWTGANIVAKAVAAGNTAALAAATNPSGFLADISAVFGTVEADGFTVNGVVAKQAVRGMLRGAQLTSEAMASQATTNEIFGVPVVYALGGLWPGGALLPYLVAGDFSQGVVGVRQDITYKVLTESVITDAAGLVTLNLAQQDMIALRVVARYAFAVPNPVTYDQVVTGSRYPFGVLRAAT
jgi:HK97 family phage major capsid protein